MTDTDAPKAAGDLPVRVLLGEGLSLVDIWQSLHASERAWIARADGAPRFAFEDLTQGSDRMLMQLLADLPAQRWINLCYGAGFTGLGAAALSWCQEAMLTDVLHIFRDQGFDPADPAWKRAAAFLNPALLPPNRQSALLEAGEDEAGVAVLVLARPEPPAADLPADTLAQLPPPVRALLGKSVPQPVA